MKSIGFCKDQIQLEPKTGMDPGPRSPNNKFVEGGIKSQSESKAKMLDYSVKRKKLYVYICKKIFSDLFQCYDFRVSNSSCFFFSIPPSLFLPSYYILLLFYCFLHPRVDLAFKVIFLHLFCLFLNLPFLAVRLCVHCSGITSTLMRPEGQLGSI